MIDHEIHCEGYPNQAYDQGKNGSDAAIKDPGQLSIRKAAKPSEPLYPAPSKFIPRIQETERNQPNPKQKNENVLCHEMTKALNSQTDRSGLSCRWVDGARSMSQVGLDLDSGPGSPMFE